MKYYYVYIMANKGRTTIYIGVTNDLVRRVYQHQQRENDSFTKCYWMDRLVYYEIYGDVLAAIAREKQIKAWRREKKNDLIAGMNPAWADLAPALNC